MNIREAICISGVNPPICSMPFCGNGHQNKYIDELSKFVKEYGI